MIVATPQSLDKYREQIAEMLGELAAEHHEIYPANTLDEVPQTFSRSRADRGFGWSVWTAAKLMSTVSSNAYL